MEIKGRGFTLRGWRTTDATALQKHANNGNVYAFLFDRFPHPYTMENAIEWISLMLNQDPFLCFVIAIDGELAGAVGIEMRTDVYRKSPLIGYWLAEPHWGKGIMTNALKLVVDYAFANLDIKRLQAGVFGNNPRSMRVLEKCGFVKEGVSKSAIIKNGEVLDEHIYALVP
ncbi:GNAT family N-acetyltransferase [Mucilaginibacter sp. BJC16-A38]|uniref:GNAT family N-acetyltransferase n=1 Tax=Mucilaginibacter phenanthrenivorans TaxID=1234842 RepID=UPI0021582D59|nr:GNAT family protein [Mucilaginibacter phenanthrenivorans]MCR8561579.1 GNAT family N-acetyltransferase [Mucilaginibacter phenanthrenivorans]